MRHRNIPSRIRTIGRLARALRRRPLQRKPRITSLNLGGDKRLIAFKELLIARAERINEQPAMIAKAAQYELAA